MEPSNNEILTANPADATANCQCSCHFSRKGIENIEEETDTPPPTLCEGSMGPDDEVCVQKPVQPTCLRVPQLDVAIVGSAQELGACVVEANVSHRFAVALDWSGK